MDTSIRIAGAAGQGVETTGDLLTHALAGLGLHVFTTQSYMSRIRGGINWLDIRIADGPLFSGREQADLLVALTPEALDWLRESVAEGGIILFNGPDQPGTVAIDFVAEAKEQTGSQIMANSVAAGAALAVLGYSAEALEPHFRRAFQRKGEEVVEGNIKCARRGAELGGRQAGKLKAPAGVGAPAYVTSGSEAIGLAAATSGVKFVTSYPMTPSTGVFTYLAGVGDEYGILIEQAEDEIAAINMVCGAAYAGVPAMTTTSGGGFALMVEGVSLAGMLELPAFIMLGQRPGPATGLPTRTGQQDLQFAVHAGHGEFPKAVYAPGTPSQAFRITRLALETAHHYQTPVIMLTDQLLADIQTNAEPFDRTLRPIDRHIAEDPPTDYLRYAVTPDGVSPRALPGSSAFVVLDSDEHTEDGHITEDLGARLRLQDKRMRKLDGMKAQALPPEWHGPPQCERLLIAWGSTYGPCREAVDILNHGGASIAMLHFSQVWPLDPSRLKPLFAKAERLVSVEGNATGQFAALLRQTGALGDCELLLRYDGMPFTAEEIARRVAS